MMGKAARAARKAARAALEAERARVLAEIQGQAGDDTASAAAGMTAVMTAMRW